jgi:hypothetical protein
MAVEAATAWALVLTAARMWPSAGSAPIRGARRDGVNKPEDRS